MHKDNETSDMPRSAPGPWKSAMQYGVIGAAIGAVFGAAFGRSDVPRSYRMISGAADTGIFAGILGYFMGERNVTEHALVVENVKLQHQVNALESIAGKSFVTRLHEEKPPCGCHLNQ